MTKMYNKNIKAHPLREVKYWQICIDEVLVDLLLDGAQNK